MLVLRSSGFGSGSLLYRSLEKHVLDAPESTSKSISDPSTLTAAYHPVGSAMLNSLHGPFSPLRGDSIVSSSIFGRALLYAKGYCGSLAVSSCPV